MTGWHTARAAHGSPFPVIALLLGAIGCVQANAQALTAARTEARAGRVDAAEAAAKTVLATDAHNAGAHALLCGLYGSIEQRDEAITECEAAASLAPRSSNDALELARAYGSKADHSGALTGLHLVGKIRSNFELAVTLDGRNVDAISDLGEFYVAAPGIAGGGTDKAKPLVARLAQLSPARAHRLQAMIYAKDKNDAGAVGEYNAEIAVAHDPEAYFGLATFYRSRKQMDKAVENARLAIAADKEHGMDTLDAAAFLIELKQDLPAVQTGLRAYLAASQTGVARFARAHYMLGQCMQATGDPAGAKKEFAAALALASKYDAARKAANA